MNESQVITTAEALSLMALRAKQKTTCPECNQPQDTNGLIDWCVNAHVYKTRKTMLVSSTPTPDAVCKSCKAPVTWVMSENGKWLPMDRGFSVVKRLAGLLRVFCDQSHFATCPNAKSHRKGRGK